MKKYLIMFIGLFMFISCNVAIVDKDALTEYKSADPVTLQHISYSIDGEYTSFSDSKELVGGVGSTMSTEINSGSGLGTVSGEIMVAPTTSISRSLNANNEAKIKTLGENITADIELFKTAGTKSLSYSLTLEPQMLDSGLALETFEASLSASIKMVEVQKEVTNYVWDSELQDFVEQTEILTSIVPQTYDGTTGGSLALAWENVESVLKKALLRANWGLRFFLDISGMAVRWDAFADVHFGAVVVTNEGKAGKILVHMEFDSDADLDSEELKAGSQVIPDAIAADTFAIHVSLYDMDDTLIHTKSYQTIEELLDDYPLNQTTAYNLVN